MKFKNFTLIFFLLIFVFSNVYAQQPGIIKSTAAADSSPVKKIFKMTVKSASKITLQFSGNYNYGVYELSGNKNDDFNSLAFLNGESFGVRHGIGINTTLKIPLHEKGNIRLNISLNYNTFNSSFNKIFSSGTASQFFKYNVFSGVVGIENNFTPNYKIKTFVGGGLLASIFTGKGRLYDDGSYNDVNLIPAFRLGVTVYSGLEYMINNSLGFNCGFRFTHANLWLKDSKMSTNPGEIYLNDKRVEPRLPYSGFKQFAWGSFFFGADLYFGITEKEYVYTNNKY